MSDRVSITSDFCFQEFRRQVVNIQQNENCSYEDAKDYLIWNTRAEPDYKAMCEKMASLSKTAIEYMRQSHWNECLFDKEVGFKEAERDLHDSLAKVVNEYNAMKGGE